MKDYGNISSFMTLLLHFIDHWKYSIIYNIIVTFYRLYYI